ncbi:D-glycero-alpha-D-manno-heptose-7-phosphate kinase [Ruminococcus flavefaciens]|uniref:D-glycero-alpha-D-manno-heptose-7-phosphate kinase n=1 Tax=Ruminococcus flavefaciens TaxID=1265 RepID=A0A1M7GCT3_RUMFL|nr:D-glycero-alpha-D-manno-heptose-7-phosphate kinase [Ruminococcus flavefaciens]
MGGGGSDIISYSSKYGGKVIGFSIDSYVTSMISAQNEFQKRNVIKYYDVEEYENSSEITNPFLRAAMEISDVTSRYSMSILSDTPPGSGLGGSAAFLNSVISAAYSLEHDSLKKEELAEISSSIEIEKLKLPVGKQDHYLSALGGMNMITFNKDGTVEIEPIRVRENCAGYLKNRLLLFHTNICRKAGEQLEFQSKKIVENNEKTICLVDYMKELVGDVYNAFSSDSPDEIGPIIQKHWKYKYSLNNNKVNSDMNDLFELCYKNGADGCKILGAGGGGFILISTKEGAQQEIRRILTEKNMRELKFDIDYGGTQIYELGGKQ